MVEEIIALHLWVTNINSYPGYCALRKLGPTHPRGLSSAVAPRFKDRIDKWDCRLGRHERRPQESRPCFPLLSWTDSLLKKNFLTHWNESGLLNRDFWMDQSHHETGLFTFRLILCGVQSIPGGFLFLLGSNFRRSNTPSSLTNSSTWKVFI